MRTLTAEETNVVAGGMVCEKTNYYGTIGDTNTVAGELVKLYEAAVFATSHVIERVADALD